MRHVGVTSQQASAFQHPAATSSTRTCICARIRPRSGGHAVAVPAPPLAISGDFPTFTLRINDDMDLDIAKEALAQDSSSRGVTADLVIMNERASSYAQDMQHAVDQMAENVRRPRPGPTGCASTSSRSEKDPMEESTHDTTSASRVTFHARNGKIIDQINRAVALFARPRKSS